MEYSGCIIRFRVEYLAGEDRVRSVLMNVVEKEGNTDKGLLHAQYRLEEYLRSAKASRRFSFRFEDVRSITPVAVECALV